jgi:Aromatic-ring-opening dioxygenase LigAB, LigA subunit
MSVNAIEKVLWQTTSNPAEAERLRKDPEAFLNDFMLDKEERAWITSWDVATMVDRGVNPMVLMMSFSAVRGMENMMEYLMKINMPREAAPSR